MTSQFEQQVFSGGSKEKKRFQAEFLRPSVWHRSDKNAFRVKNFCWVACLIGLVTRKRVAVGNFVFALNAKQT